MAMSASFSLSIVFLPSFTFESIRRHNTSVKNKVRYIFPTIKVNGFATIPEPGSYRKVKPCILDFGPIQASASIGQPFDTCSIQHSRTSVLQHPILLFIGYSGFSVKKYSPQRRESQRSANF